MKFNYFSPICYIRDWLKISDIFRSCPIDIFVMHLYTLNFSGKVKLGKQTFTLRFLEYSRLYVKLIIGKLNQFARLTP